MSALRVDLMWWVALVLLVSGAAGGTLKPPSSSSSSRRPSTRVYSYMHPSWTVQKCGAELADVLTLACQPYGGLNGPQAAPPVLAASSEEAATVRPRGIVEECCRKPCTWRTLLSYCANYTEEEAPPIPASQRDPNEQEIDNRLMEMLYGPVTPSHLRRFGSCNRCTKRCRKHGERATSPEANQFPNSINVLGTIAPELARPPVIMRDQRGRLN